MNTKHSKSLDQVIENTTQLDSVTFVPFGSSRPLTLTRQEVRSVVASKTKSGKEPSDAEITLFLRLCEHRGLNPFVKDVFLLGYDTKDGPKFETIVSYQAMLKRAEACQEYGGCEWGVLVWDKEAGAMREMQGDVFPTSLILVGGWCRVFRAGKKPEYATAALKSYDKGFGHWQSDKAFMIAKCARAKALRGAFPTDLSGMISQEETGLLERVVQVTERKRLADRLVSDQSPHVPAVEQPADVVEHGDSWEPSPEEIEHIKAMEMQS